MQASNIPSLLQKAFAASGVKNAIPVASQIGVTPGAASLTDGFPPLTMTPLAAGGVPPYGADTNGILNWLSTICQWANAGGQYPYDPVFSAAIGGYPKGAQIRAADFSGMWTSTADDNTTNPDTGGANWVKNLFGGYTPAMTFAQVDALASDQGPIIVTDMGGYLYKWTTSAYFTGYRNVRCGNMPETFAAAPRAWELAVTGGVWSMSDPKQKRLIAWFQEQGLVVPSANWIPGQGMISDLGSGNWKACDLQNMFLRKSGTDADTANARLAGAHQNDALQNIVGTLNASNIRNGVATGAFAANLAGAQAAGSISDSLSDTTGFSFDSSRVARTSVETRGTNTAVAPVILI